MKEYVYPGEGITIRETMTSALQELVEDKERELDAVVRKYAFKIQAETARDAPVDTAALRNSIEAVKNGNKSLSWFVKDGVMYGVFQELGTSRGVTAKHFMGGAFERNADDFFEEVRQAL